MALQAGLIQLVQQLSFCRDVAGVMEVLRDSARQWTGADGLTVVLREGDLCHYVEEDAIAPLWKGRRFPLETCISGWCILNRQQVAIEDIYEDPRVPHEAYRPTFVRSLAMTPIRSEDPVGAIGAYWARRHRPTAEELTVLQAMGDSAAMAFANVQLIQALQEADRRKDEFLAMLAHELRNPLAPLRNVLHLLDLQAQQAGGVAGLDARTRELMERQVRQLARLVDDLLDVARLRTGKITLHRESFDLVQLVRQGLEDRRNLFEQAGLALAADLPEVPLRVEGDPARILQVLGNLLDNSGKFTARGGRVSVRLEWDGPAGEAVLTVRDTGIGIPPEVLPRVFDVFGQAHQTLDRAQGGLGLGLSVVQGLVELHGGTIAATSEGAGTGATLTVRLPRELPPPEWAGGAPLAPPADSAVDSAAGRSRSA